VRAIPEMAAGRARPLAFQAFDEIRNRLDWIVAVPHGAFEETDGWE
jgi:hypothetical protein